MRVFPSLGPLALVAAGCLSGAAPALSSTFDAGDFGVIPTLVTDVSTTNLGGTVIYDEVIPFSVGTFVPADPATGSPGEGGQITGALQSSVVRSDKTGNFIFAFQLRDLVFTDPTNDGMGGSDNFIEQINYGSFAGFLPAGAFAYDPSQSLGEEVLDGTTNTLDISFGGDLNFLTFLTKPGGTTFFAVETTARNFTTGKFLNIEHSTTLGGGTALTTFTFDKVALPTTGTLPIAPVPLPLPAASLALALIGLGVLRGRA